MKLGWQRSLQEFFAERANAVIGVPTLGDLCFVSGRDQRLWQEKSIYKDLIDNILSLGRMTPCSSVLEIGCAAGFLAYGIAPKVGRYVGVDLAKPVIVAAKKLGLKNADFRVADGMQLPFPDGGFDAAFCYDVFTNFPDLSVGEPIIKEMLRVVKPGGYVLIGSIPDGDLRASYEKRVAEVAGELGKKYGPAQLQAPAKQGFLQLIKRRFSKVEPSIVCYYFTKADFISMAARLGADVTIADIHPLNPYKGYRFNAIFSRPSV